MQDFSLYEDSLPLGKTLPLSFHFSGDEGGTRSLHWHEHMELLFFLSGETEVLCNGQTFIGTENDLIIIECNQLHSTKGGSFFCLRIDPSFFEDLSFESILFHPHIRNDNVAKVCFENISKEHTKKQVGYEIEIKSLIYHLFAHLLRNHKIDTLSEYEILLRKNKTNKTRQILEYISQNYKTDLTTKSLAETFFLSEPYFCQLFKSQTKLSPLNYINKYRCEKAALLLENTQHSITEISSSVGFGNPNYFARVFKKLFGKSPASYRKELS